MPWRRFITLHVQSFALKRSDSDCSIAMKRSSVAEYDMSASKFLNATLLQAVDYENGEEVVIRARKVCGLPDMVC
jgi:hypothetical protein